MAMIPGRIETFRFTKLAGAKDVQQRIAGVTVTLEEVRKNNEAWEVRMLVRFDDAGDALASHRTWIFSNEAYLEGPDGKPIAYDTLRDDPPGEERGRRGVSVQPRPAAGQTQFRLQDARRDHHQRIRLRVEGHPAAVTGR